MQLRFKNTLLVLLQTRMNALKPHNRDDLIRIIPVPRQPGKNGV